MENPISLRAKLSNNRCQESQKLFRKQKRVRQRERQRGKKNTNQRKQWSIKVAKLLIDNKNNDCRKQYGKSGKKWSYKVALLIPILVLTLGALNAFYCLLVFCSLFFAPCFFPSAPHSLFLDKFPAAKLFDCHFAWRFISPLIFDAALHSPSFSMEFNSSPHFTNVNKFAHFFVELCYEVSCKLHTHTHTLNLVPQKDYSLRQRNL